MDPLATVEDMHVRRIRLARDLGVVALVLVGCPAPVDDGFGIDLMTDGTPTASATDISTTLAESGSDDSRERVDVFDVTVDHTEHDDDRGRDR